MGVVYRARDIQLGREVALKVMSPHIAADPVMRGRFETEVRVVAALTHPGILAIDHLERMVETHAGGRSSSASSRRLPGSAATSGSRRSSGAWERPWLQHRIQRRHDRRGHACLPRPPDDGAVERFDFGPLAL